MICIIDGYIDEPDCLGVPPYISPNVRYLYGLCSMFDNRTDYYTIDSIRKKFFSNKIRPENFDTELFSEFYKYDYIIIVSGVTVPGKYFTGIPLNYRELEFLSKKLYGFNKPELILVGSALFGFFKPGQRAAVELNSHLLNKFELSSSFDYLRELYNFFSEKYARSIDFNREKIILKGTEVVVKHPDFPNIVVEIETYSGCIRKENCSFCSEQLKRSLKNNLFFTREIRDIANEIKELNNKGCKYFRIGNQPDIFGYKSTLDNNSGLYRPNPDAIKELFYSIRETADLKVLHIDNGNPEIISNYYNESREILQVLVETTTSGNTIALGLESADYDVIKKNNLNSNPENTYKAIELINEIGNSVGENGLPKLLPGINLLTGLLGETKHTYEQNYGFLQKIYDDGLLLRRINIRQALIFKGTKLAQGLPKKKISYKEKKLFKDFKKKVRDTIDKSMLEKILPPGSILKNVLVEKFKDNIFWGRQLGSYPILSGIIGNIKIGDELDILIASSGYRSVTGFVMPVNINLLNYNELGYLPGINKKRNRIDNIISNRPFSGLADFNQDFNRIYIDYEKFYNRVI